jgi:hypothetical protein
MATSRPVFIRRDAAAVIDPMQGKRVKYPKFRQYSPVLNWLIWACGAGLGFAGLAGVLRRGGGAVPGPGLGQGGSEGAAFGALGVECGLGAHLVTGRYCLLVRFTGLRPGRHDPFWRAQRDHRTRAGA